MVTELQNSLSKLIIIGLKGMDRFVQKATEAMDDVIKECGKSTQAQILKVLEECKVVNDEYVTERVCEDFKR